MEAPRPRPRPLPLPAPKVVGATLVVGPEGPPKSNWNSWRWKTFDFDNATLYLTNDLRDSELSAEDRGELVSEIKNFQEERKRIGKRSLESRMMGSSKIP